MNVFKIYIMFPVTIPFSIYAAIAITAIAIHVLVDASITFVFITIINTINSTTPPIAIKVWYSSFISINFLNFTLSSSENIV